jgi:hypothetical protein
MAHCKIGPLPHIDRQKQMRLELSFGVISWYEILMLAFLTIKRGTLNKEAP